MFEFGSYNHLMDLVAQVDQQPNSPNADGAAKGGAGAEGGWGSMLTFLPLFIGIMLLFMLMQNKPQQRDQQKVKEMLGNLKKNDRVVTAGGIVGTIVNINSDQEYLTIRIDEANNTKMQVLKQSVIRVINDSTTGSESTKS
jgi:preprotein translocase subunit YajC